MKYFSIVDYDYGRAPEVTSHEYEAEGAIDALVSSCGYLEGWAQDEDGDIGGTPMEVALQDLGQLVWNKDGKLIGFEHEEFIVVFAETRDQAKINYVDLKLQEGIFYNRV